MNEFEHSTRINALLAKLKAKEPKAREELIAHSLDRLQRLSRKMFRKHPNLCTLEETDDITQKLVIRLHKMLDGLVPEDTASYFKLASQNLRWVLQDLARSSIARNQIKNSGDMSTSIKRNELQTLIDLCHARFAKKQNFLDRKSGTNNIVSKDYLSMMVFHKSYESEDC